MSKKIYLMSFITITLYFDSRKEQKDFLKIANEIYNSTDKAKFTDDGCLRESIYFLLAKKLNIKFDKHIRK